MAQRSGINRLEEANAYLEPTLRSRLEEVIAVVSDQLQQQGQGLETLMGIGLDAVKTICCLRLFEAALPAPAL